MQKKTFDEELRGMNSYNLNFRTWLQEKAMFEARLKRQNNLIREYLAIEQNIVLCDQSITAYKAQIQNYTNSHLHLVLELRQEICALNDTKERQKVDLEAAQENKFELEERLADAIDDFVDHDSHDRSFLHFAIVAESGSRNIDRIERAREAIDRMIEYSERTASSHSVPSQMCMRFSEKLKQAYVEKLKILRSQLVFPSA